MGAKRGISSASAWWTGTRRDEFDLVKRSHGMAALGCDHTARTDASGLYRH